MTRPWKLAISAFLLLHLGCFAVGMSPLSQPARLVRLPAPGGTINLEELAKSYRAVTVTGFGGRLFAPLPSRANFHLGAVVRHADGTTREFRFPRPSDAGVLPAGLYLQFHKLASNLQRGHNAVFHPDVCRYLARRFHMPENPPTQVDLILFSQQIPRHNRPEIHATENPPWVDYTKLLRDEPVFERRTLLSYTVRAEDLP